MVPSSKPPFTSNSSSAAKEMGLTASDAITITAIKRIANREAFFILGGLGRNTDISNRSHHVKSSSIHNEAAEKEM